MTPSFVDRAIAKATAPLLVEVAKLRVDLKDAQATIARLTAERDNLRWASEDHFAELDKVPERPTVGGWMKLSDVANLVLGQMGGSEQCRSNEVGPKR